MVVLDIVVVVVVVVLLKGLGALLLWSVLVLLVLLPKGFGALLLLPKGLVVAVILLLLPPKGLLFVVELPPMSLSPAADVPKGVVDGAPKGVKGGGGSCCCFDC